MCAGGAGAAAHPTRTQGVDTVPELTSDSVTLSYEDTGGDLEQVTVPTLVLHGDSDAIVPFEVSGKRTAASISGARAVVIEQGPHGFNVSHAEEFNAALLDFLG